MQYSSLSALSSTPRKPPNVGLQDHRARRAPLAQIRGAIGDVQNQLVLRAGEGASKPGRLVGRGARHRVAQPPSQLALVERGVLATRRFVARVIERNGPRAVVAELTQQRKVVGDGQREAAAQQAAPVALRQ
jgi:hypothetical protein